ncbi:RING/U-box superfamily protein [Artemisia annua]|uniref:RING/U-box superfamily protein n=1 Tax=Artemisia annua TaxID=35608 RepID=A0A2U1KEI5_ARTAN|nr:RING/U-box superfamily protein [Artemisia annua]
MDAYTIFMFYVLIVPIISSTTTADCPVSNCGQRFKINIRFPFRLIDRQSQDCGSPGFDLRCVFPSMALIDLPRSGDFGVRSIDYRSQSMQIYDPLNCLPARLLTLDLLNSPFTASTFKEYTLLRCPSGTSLEKFTPIRCLSNSSSSVIAIGLESDVKSMTSNQTGCHVDGFVRVPMVDQPDQDAVTSQLDEDITLTWGTPDCKKCEADGVSCGFANESTQLTKCFVHRDPKGASIFRMIAFAMTIPAMTASIVIACCLCMKDRRGELPSNRRITNDTNVHEEATAPPRIDGLDQGTIESYKKVVLGESKRLPGHDDAVCPICLSDYDAKETVRCIPECLHCFHAECIDEWLKMNGTCPICRNSPSPIIVEA